MPGRSHLQIRRTQLYRAALLCCVPLLLVSLAAANDWNYQETRHDSRDFVSGGSVHVHMSVGDMRIKRGDSDKIRLEYTVKSRREQNIKDARVDFDVRGKDADIEFHAPTGKNTQFDVILEVPQNTNLDVHEKVGDVTVEGVEGDKDLELSVGDIRIEKGNANYKLVRASTSIGDVHSDDYGEPSGWLGKTLKYNGDGKYELRAHVSVGDIHLDGK
ncbi:MAG TPA: DUF4097 family beta strand repeat-containing protein [Candidatus Sulfotelmatobacter sp.]|nr:DUF4097 family beta strand repeat-containing protein [Candidatus Sulfotelmatobacter sp.]